MQNKGVVSDIRSCRKEGTKLSYGEYEGVVVRVQRRCIEATKAPYGDTFSKPKLNIK